MYNISMSTMHYFDYGRESIVTDHFYTFPSNDVTDLNFFTYNYQAENAT